MFPLSPLSYVKLAGAGILAIAVAVHLFHDRRVKRDLEQTRAELVSTQNELARVKDELVHATRARDQVTAALKDAEQQSQQIRIDANKAIETMRAKKPPTDCNKLNKWLVDNKSDLKW